jgi:glycosyltransferase involved in cell wall biosynthesis
MNKKLRILLINRWVGYNEGGNETHMKDLILKFSLAGHEVFVITTQGDALEFLGDTVTCHYVTSPKKYYSYGLFGVLYAIIFNVKCFFKFIQLYMQGERFDVLSIHFSLEGILARFIKLFFGIPYVFVLAGDTYLELLEAKRADGKIQISNFMNQQCEKLGYSAEIIPKGIDLKKYNPNTYC